MSVTGLNTRYQCHNCRIVAAVVAVDNRRNNSDNSGMPAVGLPVHNSAVVVYNRPLPYAHCAQSRLVCPMSGHIMNENNPPMVLPNGYVYGENVSIGTP